VKHCGGGGGSAPLPPAPASSGSGGGRGPGERSRGWRQTSRSTHLGEEVGVRGDTERLTLALLHRNGNAEDALDRHRMAAGPPVGEEAASALPCA